MPSSLNPRCDFEPDEDHQKSTLVASDPPPGSFKKPSATPASSDSGYSSRTAASSSSKASAGKTPRPPRLQVPVARTKSISSSDTNKKTTASPSTKSSGKPAPRSSSQVRSPPCTDPTCQNPTCLDKKSSKSKPSPLAPVQHPSFMPVVAAVPHPLTMPHTYPAPFPMSNSVPTQPAPLPPTQRPLQPPPLTTAHNPPPAAVPRRRTQSASRPRPASIAVAGGTWVADPQYTRQFTVSTPIQSRPPSIHAHTTAYGQSPAQAVQAAGAWVRSEAGHPVTSRPGPPSSTRIPPSHGQLEYPERRGSTTYALVPIPNDTQEDPYNYGQDPYNYGQHAPSYDQGRMEMPPPQFPSSSLYPPRTDSRPLPQDVYNRRASMDYAVEDDHFYDPHRTIRPHQTNLRPAIPSYRQGGGGRTVYYRDADSRYPGRTLMIERPMNNASTTARRPSRVEKTDHHTRQARAYQDDIETRAIGAHGLDERMQQLRLEPPSPHHRRLSQSQPRHTRSRSRAASSIATESTSMRVTMEGNSVHIEGDTGDRNIQMQHSEDGPVIMIGGPNSPTKTREEKKYLGGGSQRSRGSFAERAGPRTGSGGSPTDIQTLVSGGSHRR